MIVRVAGEYAGAPGVARAGLSATQWRCLFQALIKQESRFNITAESHAGAYGLTQLMPGTASDMGVNPYDPMDNLRGGARYITTQLNRFGNIPRAQYLQVLQRIPRRCGRRRRAWHTVIIRLCPR